MLKLFRVYQQNAIESSCADLETFWEAQHSVNILDDLYGGGLFDEEEGIKNALAYGIYLMHKFLGVAPTDILNKIISDMMSEPDYSDDREEYMETYFDSLMDRIAQVIKREYHIS